MESDKKTPRLGYFFHKMKTLSLKKSKVVIESSDSYRPKLNQLFLLIKNQTKPATQGYWAWKTRINRELTYIK